MIPTIAGELRTRLEGRGVPYPLVYGPERVTNTVLARSHIVVQRDDEAGDEVVPPPVRTHNKVPILAREIGTLIRVFARSLESGATAAEHERIADKIVDQILVSLYDIVAVRKTRMRIVSSGFLTAADVEARGLQVWPGRVYEIRLTIARGVSTAGYDGEGATEKEAGTDFTVNPPTLDTSDSPDPTVDLPGATTRVTAP